jgi:hypothetical protein
VFGRPIEVIDADHQNKADLASAIARGWFDRQGVTAIADLEDWNALGPQTLLQRGHL